LSLLSGLPYPDHLEGQKKYGVFDPATDTRDLFHEIEEELLDTINYACYQVLKVRAMRERLNDVR